MTDWIKCSERQPDKPGWYLVDNPGWSTVNAAGWDGDHWYGGVTPTHWRDLPPRAPQPDPFFLSALDKCQLRLRMDCDGYWLEFRSPKGRTAHIWLDNPAHGPIVRTALVEWADDMVRNGATASAKKGQECH